MNPTIGSPLLSQPFLASDAIGAVFSLLALVYVLLWRREQNSGFGWFACTWLSIGLWWWSTPYQPLAGPFIAWSLFWYLFFPALFTLAFGLVAYLKVPQTWRRRTMLWVGIPIFVFITTYHLPLFGFQIQRSVANLGFGLYYCALGSLAWWAGGRERGAGHRLVAITLWAIPLLSLGLVLAGVDAPVLKYYASLPLFLLSITLLTATLLRRQWS